MDTKAERSNIFFNTRDELIRIDLRNVAYFKADRNYTEVHFCNNLQVILGMNIGQVEELLNYQKEHSHIPPFVRIGRSLIVSARHILHIDMPHQRLVLSDMVSPTVFYLSVPKDSLKALKDLYIHK